MTPATFVFFFRYHELWIYKWLKHECWFFFIQIIVPNDKWRLWLSTINHLLYNWTKKYFSAIVFHIQMLIKSRLDIQSFENVCKLYCTAALTNHKNNVYLLISIVVIVIYADLGWFSVISNLNRSAKAQTPLENCGRLILTI